MIRILVVITTGFVSDGGLTNAFMNYFRVMNKEGMVIDVASMNEPEKEIRKEIEDAGGSYYRLPDKRKSPVKYLNAFRKCSKGYDVVHVHGNSPTMAGELFLAKINGVKTRIAHCHTSRGQHPFMNVFCSPVFLKSYTCGLAVSQKAGDWIYKNHPYSVFYNAVHLDKYAVDENGRQAVRKMYGVSEKEFVIGHVGKINRQKNHSFLLDVFAALVPQDTDIKLLLIGDGPLRKEIEEKARKLGVYEKVIFTGTKSDLGKYYSDIDLFMFPSVWEGFGLALLEAQACGLSCITSVNVTKETDKTGNVSFLNFDINLWLEEFKKIKDSYSVCNRGQESMLAIRKIITGGLDCKTNAERLRQLYLRGYFE